MELYLFTMPYGNTCFQCGRPIPQEGQVAAANYDDVVAGKGLCLQCSGFKPVPAPEVARSAYEAMTVPQLREVLKDRGVSIPSGVLKDALVGMAVQTEPPPMPTPEDAET